jgi:hypothetical protein
MTSEITPRIRIMLSSLHTDCNEAQFASLEQYISIAANITYPWAIVAVGAYRHSDKIPSEVLVNGVHDWRELKREILSKIAGQWLDEWWMLQTEI